MVGCWDIEMHMKIDDKVAINHEAPITQFKRPPGGGEGWDSTVGIGLKQFEGMVTEVTDFWAKESK